MNKLYFFFFPSDALSPASIIMLGNNKDSESEDPYEVIETPEHEMKASDVECVEENPYFLSISKGRRNLLKLHRRVEWDMKADFGAQNAPTLKDLEIYQTHQRKQQARKSQSHKEVRSLMYIISMVIIDSGEQI